MESEKELLRKMGEETIHSAKGHFKACDLRRQLLTFTIWGCALLNVISIFEITRSAGQILSATALFGTIALLLWNQEENKNYRSKHKRVGEKYLALHKEIRNVFFLNQVSTQDIENLKKIQVKLDTSEKPEIPSFARKWAKRKIEGKDPETDNWFQKP